MFEIKNHRVVTLQDIKLEDYEARNLTRQYIARRFMGQAEWIDKDGYLCWDDPDHRHGSVQTIRGEKATQEQFVAYALLKIL